jgi:hypothetical protein
VTRLMSNVVSSPWLEGCNLLRLCGKIASSCLSSTPATLHCLFSLVNQPRILFNILALHSSPDREAYLSAPLRVIFPKLTLFYDHVVGILHTGSRYV